MCSEIVALRGREVEPIARGHNNSARGRGSQQIPLADNRSPFSAGLPVAARAVAGSPVFGRAMAQERFGERMPNGSETSANAPRATAEKAQAATAYPHGYVGARPACKESPTPRTAGYPRKTRTQEKAA